MHVYLCVMHEFFKEMMPEGTGEEIDFPVVYFCESCLKAEASSCNL